MQQLRCLFTKDDLSQAVSRVSSELLHDYCAHDDPIVLLGVLTGCIHFISDLSRSLSSQGLRHQLDFVAISSYLGTETTGKVNLRLKPKIDLNDKHVIIVEDIVDTGLTLSHFISELKTLYRTKSVSVCTLFDKPDNRVVDLVPNYVGITLAGGPFIVGYGLDYDEQYRELENVCELTL